MQQFDGFSPDSQIPFPQVGPQSIEQFDEFSPQEDSQTPFPQVAPQSRLQFEQFSPDSQTPFPQVAAKTDFLK
jgi:hypothetical protein